MRINSKKLLMKYIKEQLGAPLINIEITDEQLSQIIDDSVQKYTEYAYGTLEDVVLFVLKGPCTVKLPNTITNVIKLSKGGSSNITNFGTNFGSGYVPDIWSAQYFTSSLTGDIVPAIISISNTTSVLEKYFGDDIYYNFNANKKILQVFEDYHGAVALHYQYEYLANEENDFVYNNEWIKQYTVAKAKFLWGSIVGKFSQALVGGAQINYSDIKSEAQQEIERLHEELLTKWSDPAPILIG